MTRILGSKNTHTHTHTQRERERVSSIECLIAEIVYFVVVVGLGLGGDRRKSSPVSGLARS